MKTPEQRRAWRMRTGSSNDRSTNGQAPFWTDAELELLFSGLDDGEIARRVGRSRQAVHSKRCKVLHPGRDA